MKLPRSFPVLVGLLAVGLAPHLGAADAKPAKTEEPYELPKMEVKGSLTCSYGIGVMIIADRKTQAISRVFIETVAKGSDAETCGLVAGDEILKINGKKVAAMEGGIKRGSDLFELLVNQPPGQMMDVEVAVRTVRKLTLSVPRY